MKVNVNLDQLLGIIGRKTVENEFQTAAIENFQLQVAELQTRIDERDAQIQKLTAKLVSITSGEKAVLPTDNHAPVPAEVV